MRRPASVGISQLGMPSFNESPPLEHVDSLLKGAEAWAWRSKELADGRKAVLEVGRHCGRSTRQRHQADQAWSRCWRFDSWISFMKLDLFLSLFHLSNLGTRNLNKRDHDVFRGLSLTAYVTRYLQPTRLGQRWSGRVDTTPRPNITRSPPPAPSAPGEIVSLFLRCF